jgi:signal transduction histidine kinase
MSLSIVLFTVTIFLVAVIPYQRRQLLNEMHQRAMVAKTSVAQVLEESIVLEDFSTIVDYCLNMVNQNPSLRYVVITPLEGPSLIHTRDSWKQAYLDGMWQPLNPATISRARIVANPFGEGELFHISYAFSYSKLNWGWIHLGLSTANYRQDSRSLYLRSAMIAAMAVSAGFFLSLFYARSLIVPILKLEQFAHRIASGDLDQRISIHTRDEVEHLAAAFNYMVDELQRVNQERETAQKKLVDTARQAGMAEMVSNVLHNVGNALNSVGVTTSMLQRRTAGSRIDSLSQLAKIIQDQGEHLAQYLTEDPRGRKVPDFLLSLSEHLLNENQQNAADIKALERHLQHVRDIIHLQQDYSRTRGLTDSMSIKDVIEDALWLNSEQNKKHGILIEKDCEPIPPCWIDRHRLLQILINLLSNARNALVKRDISEKTIRISMKRHQDDRIRITVADNGDGIDPKNLIRIFQHGFTTRKEGHGFGLHSSAIAARELSGSLTAYSKGKGHGAVFVIDAPYRPLERTNGTEK